MCQQPKNKMSNYKLSRKKKNKLKNKSVTTRNHWISQELLDNNTRGTGNEIKTCGVDYFMGSYIAL